MKNGLFRYLYLIIFALLLLVVSISVVMFIQYINKIPRSIKNLNYSQSLECFCFGTLVYKEAHSMDPFHIESYCSGIAFPCYVVKSDDFLPR